MPPPPASGLAPPQYGGFPQPVAARAPPPRSAPTRPPDAAPPRPKPPLHPPASPAPTPHSGAPLPHPFLGSLPQPHAAPNPGPHSTAPLPSHPHAPAVHRSRAAITSTTIGLPEFPAALPSIPDAAPLPSPVPTALAFHPDHPSTSSDRPNRIASNPSNQHPKQAVMVVVAAGSSPQLVARKSTSQPAPQIYAPGQQVSPQPRPSFWPQFRGNRTDSPAVWVRTHGHTPGRSNGACLYSKGTFFICPSGTHLRRPQRMP